MYNKVNDYEHQFVINNLEYDIRKGNFEIVERKGIGHPDTLSDALAEELSIAYSKYTLENFGVILHHNFDKVGMMGGIAKVEIGSGDIKSPIRILLNGRASSIFGNVKIPVREILEDVTFKFMKARFPMLKNKDLRIIYEVSTGSSPGGIENEDSKRHRWFAPVSIDDLTEMKYLVCNDTSMGYAYYVKSETETIVYEVERYLNSKEYKKDRRWLGSDIKIMAFKEKMGDTIFMTVAIPQISIYLNSIDEYRYNLKAVQTDIYKFVEKLFPQYSLMLSVNTRDEFHKENKDMYITYTGSSIEMGDEGFVGRGNRIGGLITPMRSYTMEGICGKNPVYHTGKMCCVAAYEISKRLYEELKIETEVFLIGQSGHSLERPWKTIIQVIHKGCKGNMDEIAYEVLDDFSNITKNILNKKYPLY